MLVNWNWKGETHLVVGEINGIILHRLKALEECGCKSILITQTENDLPYEQYNKEFEELDLKRGRPEVLNIVDKVTVNVKSEQLRRTIYDKCVEMRIPINTIDSAEYSTFTHVSTFNKGDIEIGVTTNGNGCKLSSRIKRDIISKLPSDLDKIASNVGSIRSTILQKDQVIDSDDDETNLSLNKLVKEFDMDADDLKRKRINWLNQIIEYYPLSKLKDLTLEDFEETKRIEITDTAPTKGSISLVGAGPGSASLLTKGAIDEIMTADLVLADKLVPQEVLDTIPKKTEVFIARKFPGNAERAQQELLELGLEAITKGKKVVRLKQGDPYIFGRGGEEFLYFQKHGYKPTVLPGITSALSAPVLADIPMTHRDVSDQVLICTGTGRKGALPNIPEFVESRTSVFLMALHRIDVFVEALLDKDWPSNLPCAIVERASSPDQRIIRTTIKQLPQIVKTYGSRPPGLLVTGYSTEILNKTPLIEGLIN